jgi:hypothetical protein
VRRVSRRRELAHRRAAQREQLDHDRGRRALEVDAEHVPVPKRSGAWNPIGMSNAIV